MARPYMVLPLQERGALRSTSPKGLNPPTLLFGAARVLFYQGAMNKTKRWSRGRLAFRTLATACLMVVLLTGILSAGTRYFLCVVVRGLLLRLVPEP